MFISVGSRWRACCADAELVANFTGLRLALNSRLYGQHLVEAIVVPSLRGHLSGGAPTKALVLSLHGWTGSGKNHVAQLIAEHVYRGGMHSCCVHLFVATLHFAHAHRLNEYKVRPLCDAAGQ